MSTTLHPGQPAPAFEATTTQGQMVRLDEFRGRYLVLYFYPKAFTPGCTVETKSFRDSYAEIRELGAEVLGVSRDEHQTQCAFAQAHGLDFALIADRDGRISQDYGVVRALLPLTRRITYVIDPEGRIAARFHHELRMHKHLEDVLAFLKGARGQSREG